MPGISTGADEVVERDPERVAEGGELVSVSIDERPGGLAGRLGGEHVLERVLVGPAKEPDRLAQGASRSGCQVCFDEFERVPEMWIAVHIRDGDGDVRRHGWKLLSAQDPELHPAMST